MDFAQLAGEISLKDGVLSGIVAASVYMIMRGHLVPRYIMLERIKDKNDIIATIKESNEKLVEQNAQLMETSNATRKLLETINKPLETGEQ